MRRGWMCVEYYQEGGYEDGPRYYKKAMNIDFLHTNEIVDL